LKADKICVGVGIAGDTDDKRGVLRFAPNLPWRDLKIADYITKSARCPCCASNDANMAAWGVFKSELKSDKKEANVLVITMGTGIGGGMIINGDLYQGATGTAGEFGHIKVDYSPCAPLCGCGARGCFESFCGVKGIERMVAQAARKEPRSVLSQILKREKFSVEILSRAARQNCPLALKVWGKIGEYLNRAVSDLVLAFNPDACVIAGGVSRGAKYFLPAARKSFKKQAIKTPFDKLKIIMSKKGDIGGVGAALYAMSKFNEK
jgi:glucokinase